MKGNQIDALTQCAEALKDICNAADNGEPYSPREIAAEFAPLLSALSESGFKLGGEK